MNSCTLHFLVSAECFDQWPALFKNVWMSFHKAFPWMGTFYYTPIHASACKRTLVARFMGPAWAHLGPSRPRWVPYWPHELCYLRKAWCGYHSQQAANNNDMQGVDDCYYIEICIFIITKHFAWRVLPNFIVRVKGHKASTQWYSQS